MPNLEQHDRFSRKLAEDAQFFLFGYILLHPELIAEIDAGQSPILKTAEALLLSEEQHSLAQFATSKNVFEDIFSASNSGTLRQVSPDRVRQHASEWERSHRDSIQEFRDRFQARLAEKKREFLWHENRYAAVGKKDSLEGVDDVAHML